MARLAVLLLTLPVVWNATPACGAIIFVDNLVGLDTADGSSADARGDRTGPVQSINRAMQIARGTDLISIANHGVPYYEQIRIAGGRFHGTSGFPFRIVGNGAIIDGSNAVPDSAWERLDGDLWKITTFRKGFYQLVRNDQAVPSLLLDSSATKLPAIPVGQWGSWKGSIYHHMQSDSEPRDFSYRFAAREAGLSLYAVRNVRISNLTFRHFRLDGVNAHDRCKGIELDNVICTGNGRAGISVGGTSYLTIRKCDLRGNRFASLRTEEFGTANVDESILDPAKEGDKMSAPEESPEAAPSSKDE